MDVVRTLERKQVGRRIRVFPLSGSKPEFHARPWTSTNLVKWIEARGLLRGKALSLEWIVPVIHKNVPKELMLRSIASASDYSKIFGKGDRPGLVDGMDTLLTSIGRLERPWGMDLDALVREVGITRSTLNALSPGDIGGVLVPHRALTAGRQKLFDRVQASWIGLTMEHLRRLAQRAATSNAAGICVVAAGKQKAPLFRELIRLGLINQAVVDQTLALELVKLLRAEPGVCRLGQ